VGERITISGADSGWNGSYTVATTPTATRLTFALAGGAGSSGGTIKVINEDAVNGGLRYAFLGPVDGPSVSRLRLVRLRGQRHDRAVRRSRVHLLTRADGKVKSVVVAGRGRVQRRRWGAVHVRLPGEHEQHGLQRLVGKDRRDAAGQQHEHVLTRTRVASFSSAILHARIGLLEVDHVLQVRLRRRTQPEGDAERDVRRDPRRTARIRWR
jgi:hypothetical protein